MRRLKSDAAGKRAKPHETKPRSSPKPSPKPAPARPHAARDLAEILSVLSHDLRNPITAMVWNLPALLRSVTPDHPSRPRLEAVARSNEEIVRLLDDMSDAARILSGELHRRLEPKRCDFGALVTETAASLRPTAEARQLELSVEIAPGVGEVVCDPGRIARVLHRLIGRAIPVAPKGSAVAVRVDADDDDVRVSVEHAGASVTDEERASVFELPAAPASGSERRPRGAGPGISLFVARGVIEVHGGQVWVEGKQGASRFVFTLPADVDPQP